MPGTPSPERTPSGVPTLLVVMTVATLAGAAGICAFLAAGGWAMLPFALLSVLIGAAVVLAAIWRTLSDEDGESRPEPRSTPAPKPKPAGVPRIAAR